MYGFSVLLHGVTGSFREPGSHLYQATLPLPPVSAVVGMAGAALGKSFEDAWRFATDSKLCVGVSGTSKGRGIDLWNYRKVADAKGEDEKAQKNRYNLSKIARRDIVNREFLADLTVTVFYAAQDKDKVEVLHQAFEDPVYALSLGSSDDIVIIRKVSGVCTVEAVDVCSSFSDTYVAGDHADSVCFDWDALKRTSVMQTLKAPLVRPFIVDFEFDGTARHGTRLQPFTFLSGPQRLTQPQTAFRFAGSETPVPLYEVA